LEIVVDKKKRNKLRSLREKVAKIEFEPPKRGLPKRKKLERMRKKLYRLYQERGAV